MRKINKVLISPKALASLKKRQLDKQYKKAKNLLLSGNQNHSRFKTRQPYSDNCYYFRLNKQYRAVGLLINSSTFLVTNIDDHS